LSKKRIGFVLACVGVMAATCLGGGFLLGLAQRGDERQVNEPAPRNPVTTPIVAPDQRGSQRVGSDPVQSTPDEVLTSARREVTSEAPMSSGGVDDLPEPVASMYTSFSNPQVHDEERLVAFRRFCGASRNLRGAAAAFAVDQIVEALNDGFEPIQGEALLALTTVRPDKARVTAQEWLGSPAADVPHDMAIRSARQLGLSDQIPTIRQYLTHEDLLKRFCAMRALSYWGDEASRSSFEAAAQDEDYRIAKEGQRALQQLDYLVRRKEMENESSLE